MWLYRLELKNRCIFYFQSLYLLYHQNQNCSVCGMWLWFFTFYDITQHKIGWVFKSVRQLHWCDFCILNLYRDCIGAEHWAWARSHSTSSESIFWVWTWTGRVSPSCWFQFSSLFLQSGISFWNRNWVAQLIC